MIERMQVGRSNDAGPIAEPWITLALMTAIAETSPAYLLQWHGSLKSPLPSCASLLVSDACRTVSNAFEKSNQKTWTKSLSASIERTVCNIATIAAVVEPDGLHERE